MHKLINYVAVCRTAQSHFSISFPSGQEVQATFKDAKCSLQTGMATKGGEAFKAIINIYQTAQATTDLLNTGQLLFIYKGKTLII